MANPDGPLKGVKVVACSTAQAGTVPYMLMADLGAEVIKIEAPEGGDASRVTSVLPGHPSSFFETNNRGVKSVTLNLKAPGGSRNSAQAGRTRGYLRPELPAGRGREERLWLRGAEKGQPEARLHLDLRLRPEGTQRAFAGNRLHGAGAGRHRAGLFLAGPTHAHRHRLRRGRDLRHPRLRRRARSFDACARHRRRPEGRAVAPWQHRSPARLDVHDHLVARHRPGDRSGPRRRHARAAGDVGASFNDRDGKPMVFQLGAATSGRRP